MEDQTKKSADENKEEDNISIDLSKIKNFFKKLKEEKPKESAQEFAQINEEIKKSPDEDKGDELSIDFSKIKSKIKNISCKVKVKKDKVDFAPKDDEDIKINWKHIL